MVSWTIYAFECTDESARRALMDWFEANHPVEFPDDRYSVFASVETEDGESRGADYAWLDRYLYVTVMGDAEHVVSETMDQWERAAIAEFDGATETVVDGMLFLDTEAGADDEAAARPLEGPAEMAGNGLLYALAMLDQFRFRSYSAQSPTNQLTPHPHAFSVPTEFAEDFDEFVDEMAEVTGVEPTEEGLAFLRNDPAADGDYVYGETYGPLDEDVSDDGLDRVTVVDATSGEATATEAHDGQSPGDGDEAPTDSSLLGRLLSRLR